MFVVDRIEGEYVVVEVDDGTCQNFHISNFDFTVKENDVLLQVDGKFVLDEETTQKRRNEITARMNALFNK